MKYGIVVNSGGVRLLDTNRMGCVFRLYGDTHKTNLGRLSQVDYPLPLSNGAKPIFGDYSNESVVRAFNDGYQIIKDGGGTYRLRDADGQRYKELVSSAAVPQELETEGNFVTKSSHPLVGCTNNIRGASNYDHIIDTLPKPRYGFFAKHDLVYLSTCVPSYKLISVETVTTHRVNSFRSYIDPNSMNLDAAYVSNRTKQARRDYDIRTARLAKPSSVVSIPCLPTEIIAIQSKTFGVSIALLHKSPTHEIYMCVGSENAELKVYRYTNDTTDRRIAGIFHSHYGLQVKGDVSNFDSRQPLLLPLWVSYSAKEVDNIVNDYDVAIVFSNIRNFVNVEKEIPYYPSEHHFFALPAIQWTSSKDVKHSFVCMVNSKSILFHVNVGPAGGISGMITNHELIQKMIDDGNALRNYDDWTRMWDVTRARNYNFYMKNWENMSDMGGYMAVVAY